MLQEYGHLASFLDATTTEGIKVLERLEAGRPDAPITTISLKRLQALRTPSARKALLTHFPKTGKTLDQFNAALELAEWHQWIGWHWQAAPQTHIAPGRRRDLHRQASLRASVPTSALSINLGAWKWQEGVAECPKWSDLAKAKIWTDVLHTALRCHLASTLATYQSISAPGQVLALLPRQGAVRSGAMA